MPTPPAPSDVSERPVAAPFWSRRGRALVLGLILLLGFLLRAAGVIWGQAYNPDGGQGDGVEAYEVAVAYQQGSASAAYLGQPRFRTGSKLPGPAWTLVCVAGLKSGGSIAGLSWLLVGANVVAIFLIHRFARQTVGPDAALIAALLAATSAQAVQNSVVVYNPAVLPLLATLLFLALWQVLQTDRSRAICWLVALLAVLPQFHMTVVLLVPAAALLLWLSARPLNLPWLGLGLLLGALCYLPYLLGESRQDWANTRAMWSAVGAEYTPDPLAMLSSPARFLINYWAPRSLFTGAEFTELSRATLGGENLVTAFNVLSVALALLLLAGTVLATRSALAGTPGRSLKALFARAPGLMFCLILFVVPLLTGICFGLSFRPRYCLMLLAPLYALAGLAAMHWLAEPRFRRSVLALGVIVTSLNVFHLVAMYRFQGRHIETAPRFLGSFSHLEQVYQSLRRFAGEARPIAVNDLAFVAPGGTAMARWHLDAYLIRRYVKIRESERLGSTANDSSVLSFDLLSQPSAGDSAFSGNGLVLLPTSPRP